MKFTYYGHSCFLIETKGKAILFDPFISGNELAKDVDINSIQCDYILVSHGHQDHIGDLLSIAKRTGAKVIGSWELGFFLEENGVTNYHQMNVGGGFDFDIGYILMTTAIHSNSYKGRYMGFAAGFIVKNEEGCFYYSGDTALTFDMKLLANKFNITTAALPVGGNFTMDYKDALEASEFVKCNNVIAVHYDTFPPIKINQVKAEEYFSSSNKRLNFLQIGESTEI
jgi:L-ascorbate metabolism protein UlaG (beta-lactamase superfamily)